MTNKTQKLSPLGFLLESLDIPTSTLARFLHVDASLVSKWKSGDRKLGKNSVYFSDTIAFLMSPEIRDSVLEILQESYPEEPFEIDADVSKLLTSFMLTCHFQQRQVNKKSRPLCTTDVSVYDECEGRRQAISDLLDMAESLQTPREILFIDCEQYRWLLEDEEYASVWVKRMFQLLERGFHARFVVHFSSGQESFIKFFRLCGTLFFHKNVQWYKHQYYDDEIHWFSFFILENTMSVMGISMSEDHSYTAVFPDPFSIMHHKAVVESVIRSSEPFFENYSPDMVEDLMKRIASVSRLGTILYAYLPVPALISSGDRIIGSVLGENGIDSGTTTRCIELCREFSRIQMRAIEPYMGKPGKIVNIFQLDRMERCVYKVPFTSRSLSLLAGREITARQDKVAESFDCLADSLKNNEHCTAALASELDFTQITEMNCWCEKDRWLLQMDKDGYRFCDEANLAAAATTIFERSYKRIPSCRKTKDDVIALIKKLADDIRDGAGIAN